MDRSDTSGIPSASVAKVLVESFGLGPMGAVADDIVAMMTGN